MSYFGAHFDEVLRLLRREFPTKHPVKVRTVPKVPSNVAGDCEWMDRYWRIRIHRGLSQMVAIDTLTHEWAHVLDMEERENVRDFHRDSWGRHYSRIYRKVYDNGQEDLATE